MTPTRLCDCHHPYPLCGCSEGYTGRDLLQRSRFLSSLAGWPAKVTDESARAVLAKYGQPVPGPAEPPPEWWPEGLSFALFADATPPKPDGSCGCGRA